MPFNHGPTPPVLNTFSQNFGNIGMPQIGYNPFAMMPPQPSTTSSGSASCCAHRNTIVQNEYKNQSPNMLQGCNCGDTCTCVHCPEHPHNSQTMDFMAGTMQNIRTQNLPSPHMSGLVHLGAPYTSANSCMGSTQMAYAQSASHDDTAYGAYQHAAPGQKAAVIYEFWGSNRYPSAQSTHTRVGDTWVSHGIVQTDGLNDYAYQMPLDPQNLGTELTHGVEHMDWDQQVLLNPQGSITDFNPVEAPQGLTTGFNPIDIPQGPIDEFNPVETLQGQIAQFNSGEVPKTWDEMLDETSKILLENSPEELNRDWNIDEFLDPVLFQQQ